MSSWWHRLKGTQGSPRPGELVVPTLALMACGLVVLASAAQAQGAGFVLRQVLWMCCGMVLALGLRMVSYQRWLDGAFLIYGIAMCSLLVVLATGRVSHGAARWLSLGPLSFQPAEIAKLATVMLLARVLGDTMGREQGLSLRRVWVALLIGAAPALLVFAQPDLGSATVIAWVTVAMLWAAGLRLRYLVGGSALMVGLAPLGWHLLKEYQRTRLLVFLNPDLDPLGAGYTTIQSRIAIGSGVLWGQGWMAGTQGRLNFLPERQTDFIFSVVGEEWGFLGGLVLLGLFALWLGRAWRLTSFVREGQGRLLVVGLVAWIGYHVVVNVGMTLGLLPVVGIPLPLISYGGSAVVMTLVAVGIIESVRLWSPRF